MQRAIFIFCCWAVSFIPVFAQDKVEQEAQSYKDQAALLSGTAKADMLIKVALRYIFSSDVRADSGLTNIKKAYAYADSIGYKKGLCNAASLYARVLLQLGRADEGLHYFRITADLANETGNKLMQATGIRGMGQALWFQGNYQEAIDTILSAVNYYRRLGDNREISDGMLTISTIYGDQGNYEKAFETAQQALELSKAFHDGPNTILSLLQLCKLYRSTGDYSTALEYCKLGYTYRPQPREWTYRHLAHNMGDLKYDNHQYDSALYYYRQSFAGNPSSRMSQLKMGQFYLLRADYDSAFYYFNLLLVRGENSGEGNIYYSAMLGLAKVYLERKNYTKALEFGNKVWARTNEKNARLTLRDACEVLAAIYDAIKQPQKALDYYRQFVQLKDGIVTDQFKGKLFEFKRIAEDDKKISQIELLKKESQIAAQNLNETRILRNILVIAIVFLSLLGVTIFWNITLKRKNEKLRNESSRAEWQKAATDLEMQALRAQMNPHFIFNCLSSINRFILKNEPDQASDYLTRFSRLIRMVLINSQRSLIQLEDEVEMLRLYLEMERLRFKDQFNYSITYTNDIKPANIMIPPLLLQPFCENAIWHGLMHKEGKGHLFISFTMEQGVLQCTITDDGIGRAKAAQIKNMSGENRKSVGLKLTAERLALFNEDSSIQTSWAIDDVIGEDGGIVGTRVTLNIRYKESIEDAVEQ